MQFPWDEATLEEADEWSDDMDGLEDEERFKTAKKKLGAVN